MRRALPLLFDAILWLAFVVVHGTAIALTAFITAPIFEGGIAQRAFAVAIALILYLHLFVLVLGLTRRLVQPRLHEGKGVVGANRAYIAWGLNSVFQGLYLGHPLRTLIELSFTLRHLHLRLSGMTIGFGTIVGVRAELRQLELIEVGDGSTVGLGAVMSCHITADGKSHRQARIRVGRRSLVGAFSSLAPGVVVGDGVIVGYGSSLSEDVVVEDGAILGGHCIVRRGVRIGRDARIDTGVVVNADVPPGARVRLPAPVTELAS